MKKININIKRKPEQSLELNENQVEFIISIRGKDDFLKKAAADFLRKKKQYETQRRT